MALSADQRVKNLVAAIEGECDGLAISEATAAAILAHIDKPAKKRAHGPREIARPDEVEAEIWEDFMRVRKTKRAAMTQTALRGLAREAKKAGVTLQVAIEICCERGWQSLRAEWLDSRGRGGPSGAKRSIHGGFAGVDYNKGIGDDGSFS